MVCRWPCKQQQPGGWTGEYCRDVGPADGHTLFSVYEDIRGPDTPRLALPKCPTSVQRLEPPSPTKGARDNTSLTREHHGMPEPDVTARRQIGEGAQPTRSTGFQHCLGQ